MVPSLRVFRIVKEPQFDNPSLSEKCNSAYSRSINALVPTLIAPKPMDVTPVTQPLARNKYY